MNILGFNIGQNYKGILNIGSTINSPLSGTLQAVTDGMGVASPLQLSTSQANIAFTGTSTANNQSILSASGTFTSRATASDILRFGHIASTLTSTALSQTLIGLDVSPTFNAFDANTIFVGYRVSSLANTQNNSAAFWASQSVGTSNSISIRPANSRWQIAFNASATSLTSSAGGSIIVGASGVSIQPSGGTSDAVNTFDVIGNTYIGSANAVTASARLHVRGDGTNPIARFEDGTGTQVAGIGNNGFISGVRFATLNGQSRLESGGIVHSGGNGGYFTFGQQSQNAGFIFSNSSSWSLTSGTAYDIDFQNITFGAASGNANYRKLNLAYTINNTGAVTGTATGIFLNATETALNGMTHNLMDLQVGGVSRVIYNSNSNVLSIGGSGASRIAEIYLRRTDGQNILSLGADGVIGTYQGQNMTFQINSVTQMLISSNTAIQFNYLVRFAGATNAFPALKRSSAELQVRLADDSGFASLQVGDFRNNGNFNIYRTDGYYVLNYGNSGNVLDFNPSNGSSLTIRMRGQTIGNLFYIKTNEDRIGIGTDTPNASAILDISTTTKGFLPPRQTEAQRLAISSPAVGLIVYQTDATAGLYVYKTGGWQFIA